MYRVEETKKASSSSNNGTSNRSHDDATRSSSSNIVSSNRSYGDVTRQSSILSWTVNHIIYKDTLKRYMYFSYATKHNPNIPGTFQEIFHCQLKINNLPGFGLGNVPGLEPKNPCADSMHGSSNDPPALHQRTSVSNSSLQNNVLWQSTTSSASNNQRPLAAATWITSFWTYYWELDFT